MAPVRRRSCHRPLHRPDRSVVTFGDRRSARQRHRIGSTMRDGFQTVFTPVQSFMGTATGPVVDFFESTSDLLSLRAENRRLRDEVAVLELQLRDTESLASRVGELEDIPWSAASSRPRDDHGQGPRGGRLRVRLLAGHRHGGRRMVSSWTCRSSMRGASSGGSSRCPPTRRACG